MIYQCKIALAHDLVNTYGVDEETIKRKLACKLITDLPMESLEKIFTFSCFEPNTAIDETTPEWLKDKLMRLKSESTIEWNAQINI